MKRFTQRVHRLFAGVAATAAVVCTAACSGSAGFVPASQGPTPSGASTVVTSLADSGAGSLRSAIQAANSGRAGNAPSITFAVHGTIKLSSALPAIRHAVTIDGTSAPTYAGRGPVVEIDCNGFGGLVFSSGSQGSQLLALAVDDAKGNGVTLAASDVTLNLDYIGVDLSGKAFGNHGNGVELVGSTGDDIGENAKQISGAVANVISGNGENGIELSASSSNTIVSNRIGTNASGTAAIPNGANGIWVTAGSNGNEIGGTVYVDGATGKTNNPTGSKGTTTPVFVVPPLGNVVSGNAADGIRIDAASKANTLNGNFIGTTADGDAAIGNGGDGVLLSHAGGTQLIGCTFSDNPFVYYNIMAGNGRNGLHVTDSDDVTVHANFFGVGANNTTILGNKGDGMLIDGSSRDTQVGGVIPLGNVSAGNGRNGIEVTGSVSGFTTFNTFGGLLAFKGPAANGNDGLLITATGGNQTVRTNVFSGNAGNGIEIAGDASGVVVEPNIVGLTTKGDALMPNGNDGVLVGGTAHGIVLGGYSPSVIPQNTFSGNKGYGVAFVDRAHDDSIFGSDVGTNVLATQGLGNQLGGIYVGGHATRVLIGGTSTDPRKPAKNIVSANGGIGVTLDNGTSYIQVIDNWIGLDRHGNKTLPNAGLPIVVKPGSVHDTISGNVTAGEARR